MSSIKSNKIIVVIIITILVTLVVGGFLLGIFNFPGIENINESQDTSSKMKIEFSTIFGGLSEDDAYNIIFDDENNIYVVGATRSSDFPIVGGFQSVNPSGGRKRSGFIAKLSPQGELIRSTLLGGTGHDTIRGLAFDNDRNIVVAGDTTSTDFPTTPDALNQTASGGKATFLTDFCCMDGFFAKISPDFTTLVYSSYIGASSGGEGRLHLSLDKKQNMIISGITTSNNFPTTENSYQPEFGGEEDIFFSVISADGSQLLYSTYIGGNGSDSVFIENHKDIGIDNYIYLTGGTDSKDFPINVNTDGTRIHGASDAFYMKINPETYDIEYSTLFGGSSSEFAHAITLDSKSNIYVTGNTNSDDFPTTQNAFQSSLGGGGCVPLEIPSCGDGFISKYSPSGELLFSSYFGGRKIDNPFAMVTDGKSNIFIGGWVDSFDFPTKNAYQNYSGGTRDAFILVIAGSNLSLLYSSYIGGQQTDYLNKLNINGLEELYITGFTQSTEFPTTDETKHKSGSDVYILKFEMRL